MLFPEYRTNNRIHRRLSVSPYGALVSLDILLSRSSVLVEITAVIKTERLLLCVSLSIIRNRMDLQDYCSVCICDLSHTQEKKEKKRHRRSSAFCLLGLCITTVKFNHPDSSFQLVGERRKKGGGEVKKGSHSSSPQMEML